jgi:uncharacterized protein with HEPN domain
MKFDDVYLKHILDAITWIEEYLKNESYESFEKNHLLQDGLIREIEIIGEAARNLSEDIKIINPDIPWKDIIGMRNKLIHNYFGVDIKAVWITAKNDIPELKLSLSKLI